MGKTKYNIGDRVRIKTGFLKGRIGVISEVIPNQLYKRRTFIVHGTDGYSWSLTCISRDIEKLESKKVLASKFEIVRRLKPTFDYKSVNVYTRHEATTEKDILKLYITQDKIKEWKQQLIKEILDCENPFEFSNGDYDAYEIPEYEIFEMPEGYVRTGPVISDEW